MADTINKKEPLKVAPDIVTITIDGQSISVTKGTTVLKAAKMLGIHIPTFCWHPKLKSVGSCRMCYVEVEKLPKLQVSCLLEAMDGMVVYTNSDLVKRGRKAVIEFILLNHPLDCPTCDKGGECDLQNLTYTHGYDDSRFNFRKYRFREDSITTTFDDIPIGPEIILNRNRCILCYRCVRANKEAFGEYDLGAYERGNITEINAAPGEQVDNPYSGNLVEICPVGALTNSDWRYKIRVWLTKTTPSICNFSSSGTNITFYKEDNKNKIYRVTSRSNDEIDDGWLSDITRYGYQIVNSPDRLKTPLIKKEGKQVEATWEEALNVIDNRCREIKDKMGGVCIGGLIAPHLDNSSLYSFSKMLRTVFKSNNIDFRSDYKLLPKRPDTVFNILKLQPFSISAIDDADVIITFGSDLIREHPNEYLRIRKAYNFNQPKIYSINPYAVKSADVANLELIYKAGMEETLINGICLAGVENDLVNSAQGSELKKKITPSTLKEAASLCGVDEDSLVIVAQALAEGKKITFIAGELITRSIEREAISTALANLNKLFGINQKGQIASLPRYANSRGADLLGLFPQPSNKIIEELKNIWGEFPEGEPNNTDAMMALIKKEEIKGFFIFGANPLMLYPDRGFVKESLEKLDFLVVSDLFETATTELADVVLPLSSWAEYDGSYINLEGKVQVAYKAVKPIYQSKPAYEIVALISNKFNVELFTDSDQLSTEIDRLLNLDSSLPFPDEFSEVKPDKEIEDNEYKHPLFVVDDPHHSGHLTEKAASLANFASVPYIELSPELAAAYNLNEGDSIRVESEVGKIIVPVKISDALDNEVVLIPRNFPSASVNSLLMRKKRVDRVKISKVDE
ncbi:MAG: NADH-quinone oxidoreductase subunit NuoG [Candidatus Zixiibacteriota bacterium]